MTPLTTLLKTLETVETGSNYGSVAEWSKALVLGTSLCGGVGSNPTAAIISILLSQRN